MKFDEQRLCVLQGMVVANPNPLWLLAKKILQLPLHPNIACYFHWSLNWSCDPVRHVHWCATTTMQFTSTRIHLMKVSKPLSHIWGFSDFNYFMSRSIAIYRFWATFEVLEAQLVSSVSAAFSPTVSGTHKQKTKHVPHLGSARWEFFPFSTWVWILIMPFKRPPVCSRKGTHKHAHILPTVVKNKEPRHIFTGKWLKKNERESLPK